MYIYDFIIGNVPVARAADDPDPSWTEAGAVTTAQGKAEGKPVTLLRVQENMNLVHVNREKLVKQQERYVLIKRYRRFDDTTTRGDQEISFEEREGVLYRIYRRPSVNKGRQVRQVEVPQTL